MDRRGFLKSIGKVIAGCVVAPSVVKAELAPTEGKPPEINEATQYLTPSTKIDLVRHAIYLAESRKYNINKILCTPSFMEEIKEEMESKSNVYCRCGFHGRWPVIMGEYRMEVKENLLLGDIELYCDEVIMIFRMPNDNIITWVQGSHRGHIKKRYKMAMR